MSSEYSIANFNFYVAAYIFYQIISIDTISLTLNNGGNCRKQKPQTVKRCFVRPSVRQCGANKSFTFPRNRPICSSSIVVDAGLFARQSWGSYIFLKGMVFQVSELSQKQLLRTWVGTTLSNLWL